MPMMSVEQTSHLIDWAIVGLILIGGLFYFFGPVALRTDDVIAIGLVILRSLVSELGCAVTANDASPLSAACKARGDAVIVLRLV
jgi:hypothetical protein